MNKPAIRFHSAVAKWMTCALIAATGPLALAQSVADETASRIKSAPEIYHYGEGTGTTLEEARKNALADLSQSIRSVVWTDIVGEENNMESTISARTGISSFTTLGNTETIEFPFDEKLNLFRVMQYVKRTDLLNLVAERAEKIREWVEAGRKQESRLELSNALKYYYWALCLSNVHSSPLKIKVENTEVQAKPWLESKISNLLNAVEVSLENIEERNDPASPIVANLRFSVKGQPVNGLQFSYYTGLRRIDNMNVKNGQASLEFPRLPQNGIPIKYQYAFIDEARLFDPELEAYFSANAVRNFTQADQTIPVKGTTVQTFAIEPKTESEPVAAQSATSAPVVANVQIAKPRKRVETIAEPEPEAFLEAMEKVEMAILGHNYGSVESLFTAEGYAMFTRMMNSGNVKVTRTKGTERRIDQAEGFIIAKPIPVQITYKGGHKCHENIVLRFTRQGKISSVAYALSSRAEDDIFRQNMWSMKARYAMLQFMEDYQTAFALKDIDYIDKIFASNAVIINAVTTPATKRKARRGADGYFVDNPSGKKVRYTKRNKEEYLDYLRKDFARKRFIQLTFEDTEIAAQADFRNQNSVYWIELKQNYASNSYCDVGYLTLMIDLQEIDPYILVRTWTPDKLDLRDMMRRYTLD